MVYYIKVTLEVAKKFCSLSLRNATKDGNILLWMADLNSVPGDTIAQRAEYVGGALLTANEANDEYWGYTDEYSECHTPDYLGGESAEEKKSKSSQGGDSASGSMEAAAEVSVKIPSVEGKASNTSDNENEEEK